MKLWIRLDAAIRSDPNVAELAARLNLKKAEAVGLCTLVWAAIAEHRPTGDITGVGISALEDWGCWVPRKGAGAGAFGAAFLDLFASAVEGDPSSIEASGWLDRQGSLVEKAEKERLRKAEERRKKSADISGTSAPTERNGTEQDQKPTTARVRARLLESDWTAFDGLLSRVPDPETWSAELDAMLEGMAGHHKAAPAQIGRAIRDLIANGKDKHPNIRQLRRYVEGAKDDKPLAFPVNIRARAERLYAELPKHGFTQNRPIAEHLSRAKELSERGIITGLAQFTRELEALLPLTWLRDAKDFTREKDIARIAQVIAPLQKPAAA